MKLKHTAIPNGMVIGKDRGAAIAKMKYLEVEGFNKGFPDLIVLVPHQGETATVFIELKRKDLKPKRNGKGGVSTAQQEWVDALNRCKETMAAICYGCDEAQDLIKMIMKD